MAPIALLAAAAALATQPPPHGKLPPDAFAALWSHAPVARLADTPVDAGRRISPRPGAARDDTPRLSTDPRSILDRDWGR